MTTLGTQEQAVLNAIRSHVAAHGYPPTVREIGLAVGLGTSVVTKQLDFLALRGYLRRDPHRARALVILDAP